MIHQSSFLSQTTGNTTVTIAYYLDSKNNIRADQIFLIFIIHILIQVNLCPSFRYMTMVNCASRGGDYNSSYLVLFYKGRAYILLVIVNLIIIVDVIVSIDLAAQTFIHSSCDWTSNIYLLTLYTKFTFGWNNKYGFIVWVKQYSIATNKLSLGLN